MNIKAARKKFSTKPTAVLVIAGLVAGLGTTLLLPESSHAFASARFAIQEICKHMQGSLGALLFIAAGIGSIVSAALGNVRASSTLFLSGIGAATISAMLSFYFPEAGNVCKNGSGAATTPAPTAPGAAPGGNVGPKGVREFNPAFGNLDESNNAADGAASSTQAAAGSSGGINPAVIAVLRGEPLQLQEPSLTADSKDDNGDKLPEELESFTEE